MATAFPARSARLSAATDRAFGELFRFEAMIKTGDPNARPVADGSRPTFEAIARWESPSQSQTPAGRGSASDDRASSWSASMPSVSIEDAKMPWLVLHGDKITRLLDGSVYQALAPLPDGFGRTIIKLTSKKR
jgi:hypothetical protein